MKKRLRKIVPVLDLGRQEFLPENIQGQVSSQSGAICFRFCSF